MRKAVGDQPSVLYYLGRLDLDEHDYKKAMTNLNKASAKPACPDTAYYLGLAYARDGKWLKEAVRLHPDDSRRATGEGLKPRST